MLSFINMKCSACEAVYTLSIEQLNIVLLFKCYECGQHNVYVAGNIIELDQKIMTEGTDADKRKHIVEMVQDFASEYAENVFAHIDRMINVNVDIEIKKPRRRRRKRMTENSEQARELPRSVPVPSVKHADAPEITAAEVKDFVQIDLNLIDKKHYFDKFFRSN
jgi:Zn ribbon nucleic-acid-binding protein